MMIKSAALLPTLVHRLSALATLNVVRNAKIDDLSRMFILKSLMICFLLDNVCSIDVLSFCSCGLLSLLLILFVWMRCIFYETFARRCSEVA